jgi:hypothetical protein
MKFFLLFMLLTCSGFANATLMLLQPERSSYQVGDTIRLELKLTGLTTSVGSFWSRMVYQPSVLQLQDWQFGAGLDDGLGSLRFADHDAVNGLITLDEYADPAADLATLMSVQQSEMQQGGLVLAKLTFQALQAGNVQLMLDPKWFGVESFAGQQLPIQTAPLDFNVTAAQVPAPATIMMVLLSVVVMSLRRR